jgi:spermidine dehydrogenase
MGSARDDKITRRDFLEGSLIAAGGLAVLGSFPARALAHYPPGTTFPPDGAIGLDPRVLRGGNLRATFDVAHLLRDGRLTWRDGSVKVEKRSSDNLGGSYAVSADTGTYDLIIVGGGISGLSAAYFARKLRPNAKILILENNGHVGGNASRDDASPALPVLASAAAAYIVYPYDEFLFDIYDTIGVEYAANLVAPPFYNYYFDSFAPPTTTSAYLPGFTTKWVVDPYDDKGIDTMPFPASVLRDFHAARQDFRGWYNTHGSPTDPPDNSDPKYDYLAYKTLRDYLTVDKAFHPAVADFYDQYASDALACVGRYANAYHSISFIAAEYFPISAFPGGNSYIARRALKFLIPAAIAGSSQSDITNNPIDFAQLDKTANAVRYRTGANVLRADTSASGASVRYYSQGRFFKANARAVILAGQMHTGHRLTEHLMSAEQLSAAGKYWTIPVPIANVAVNNSRFLVNAGMSYDYYWFGSKFWQDAVVADYTTVMNDPARKNDGSRPNVLTFYSGFFTDPATTRQEERVKLLTTPFGEYEDSLRDDMTRIFGPYGFDWNRDVSAVYLYRWGHGMVVPYVGWTFGQPTMSPTGQIMRTEGARAIGRRQIGRISFAAQDSEGAPGIEDAIYAGKRTAEEVAGLL